MKSNVDGVQFGSAQRAVEAGTQIAQLGQIRTQLADQDLVIVGDTNIKSADDAAVQALKDAGFRDLNLVDRDTFVTGANSPFDRVFVLENQSEFRFSREYVLIAADADAHDGFLSDHFMVLAPVRIQNDDD